MYAEYNYQTNKTLSTLMLEVSNEQLHQTRPFYYKSLYSLYKHLIVGSWHYLKAINFLHYWIMSMIFDELGIDHEFGNIFPLIGDKNEYFYQ